MKSCKAINLRNFNPGFVPSGEKCPVTRSQFWLGLVGKAGVSTGNGLPPQLLSFIGWGPLYPAAPFVHTSWKQWQGCIALALNSPDQEYLVVLFGHGGQKDLLGIRVNKCVYCMLNATSVHPICNCNWRTSL